MNAHAKAILNSQLAAVGNPPLTESRIVHPVESSPLRNYTATFLDLDEFKHISFLRIDTRALRDVVQKGTGIRVMLDGNPKHDGNVIKITATQFQVQVGTAWHRINSGLRAIHIPVGVGRFCFTFAMADSDLKRPPIVMVF